MYSPLMDTCTCSGAEAGAQAEEGGEVTTADRYARLIVCIVRAECAAAPGISATDSSIMCRRRRRRSRRSRSRLRSSGGSGSLGSSL